MHDFTPNLIVVLKVYLSHPNKSLHFTLFLGFKEDSLQLQLLGENVADESKVRSAALATVGADGTNRLGGGVVQRITPTFDCLFSLAFSMLSQLLLLHFEWTRPLNQQGC